MKNTDTSICTLKTPIKTNYLQVWSSDWIWQEVGLFSPLQLFPTCLVRGEKNHMTQTATHVVSHNRFALTTDIKIFVKCCRLQQRHAELAKVCPCNRDIKYSFRCIVWYIAYIVTTSILAPSCSAHNVQHCSLTVSFLYMHFIQVNMTAISKLCPNEQLVRLW